MKWKVAIIATILLASCALAQQPNLLVTGLQWRCELEGQLLCDPACDDCLYHHYTSPLGHKPFAHQEDANDDDFAVCNGVKAPPSANPGWYVLPLDSYYRQDEAWGFYNTTPQLINSALDICYQQHQEEHCIDLEGNSWYGGHQVTASFSANQLDEQIDRYTLGTPPPGYCSSPYWYELNAILEAVYDDPMYFHYSPWGCAWIASGMFVSYAMADFPAVPTEYSMKALFGVRCMAVSYVCWQSCRGNSYNENTWDCGQTYIDLWQWHQIPDWDFDWPSTPAWVHCMHNNLSVHLPVSTANTTWSVLKELWR